MLPFQEVPIIINSFNRLGCLRRLVGWLLDAGHANLHIIDNASTYPPLLDYLRNLVLNRQLTITWLAENDGPRGLWEKNLIKRLEIRTEYVYTDPDIVPAGDCPRDLVGFLQSVLADNPNVAAAGVGLRLDDLPDTYRYKADAIAWESQFWLKPAGPGLFYAPLDTTFALYRPGGGHSRGKPTIRTDSPYLAAHEGWYLNHGAPSEEDLFYNRTAKPRMSHWSMINLPDWIRRGRKKRRRQS